jgi:hypothetical protein
VHFKWLVVARVDLKAVQVFARAGETGFSFSIAMLHVYETSGNLHGRRGLPCPTTSKTAAAEEMEITYSTLHWVGNDSATRFCIFGWP